MAHTVGKCSINKQNDNTLINRLFLFVNIATAAGNLHEGSMSIESFLNLLSLVP